MKFSPDQFHDAAEAQGPAPERGSTHHRQSSAGHDVETQQQENAPIQERDHVGQVERENIASFDGPHNVRVSNDHEHPLSSTRREQAIFLSEKENAALAFHRAFASPRLRRPSNTIISEHSPDTESRQESAIHGLLALSSRDNFGVLFSSPSETLATAAVAEESSSSLRINAPVGDFNKAPSSGPDEDSTTTFDPGDKLPSPERTVQLLSHYRYEIAPWLDNCDLDQAFGSQLSRPEQAFPAVHYAILALAAQSLSPEHLHTTSSEASTYYRQMQTTAEQQHHRTDLEVTQCLTLETLLKFISSTPSSWSAALEMILQSSNFHSAAKETNNALVSAVRWSYLRLGNHLSPITSRSKAVPQAVLIN